MKKLFNKIPLIFMLTMSLFVISCGSDNSNDSPAPTSNGGNPGLPPVGIPQADDSVVHGRAEVTIQSDQPIAFIKFFNDLFSFNKAFAATGSTTVTYTNVASTNFSINVGSFVPGSFTGNTLSLGSVSIATLDDNNLKVCNPGGNTKCTQAVIRVYTIGSVAGFVQTTDLYGAPVYAGSLNPTSAVGLNTAGSVQVQVVSIAGSKNRLKLTDFPTPTYQVSSDFSNSGSGSYSMVFVVEYALLP